MDNDNVDIYGENSRTNKKYLYFYKITNNINQKFYYGIHCTNNLDDGYMGSGKLLKQAQKKYGIENFSKEIIKFCDTLQELSDLEKSVVNEQLIADPNCYNMILGGYYISEETLDKIKNTMSIKQSGNKNSQYNKVWITDGDLSLSINKSELDIYLNKGFRKGRIIKNKVNIIKANQNKCWVHKGLETRKIYKTELDKFLNDGYLKGRIDKIKTEKEEKIKSGSFSWKGKVYVIDNNDNKFWINRDDPKYISGEYVSFNKGKIYVKDKQGNKIGYVDINDPKYLSGEYIPIREYKGTPNRVTCKDKDGNVFSVDKNDERLKSGELVGINKGKTWKQKKENPFYGYKWMIKNNIRTRVSPDKIEEYLNNGYEFGYKVN